MEKYNWIEKNNMKNEAIDIEYSDVKVDVLGIVTSYKKRVWIEDFNHENLGYFDNIEEVYTSPKINVEFEGKVINQILNPLNMYHDGINVFRALSHETIVNINTHLNSFSVPKKLILVANMCAE